MVSLEMIEYRREIDGLRALAIVPVIFFHAGFELFQGGFVGVDVFFVISGYLITSIILAEFRDGEFSITRFYERRARRILPALYVVIGASTIFGYAFMLPDEFKNYGQSIFAAALFSNNILLASTSGYWDLASEFKPLLHTWSLGVEEQYYIIFPIFMILGWRFFRNKLFALLSFVFAASFLGSIWTSSRYPAAAFYLLPTRAWEIAIGALVATYLISRPARSRLANAKCAKDQFWSLAGIIMIIASVALIERGPPWTCYLAIAPTFGAALIILFAQPGTLTHRLLGSNFMVSIGLISYSLYLWHQPLIAFSKIYSATPPGTTVTFGLIFLTAFLSYLSWKFIEMPFRSSSVAGYGFLAMVITTAFVLLGFSLNKNYGFPERIFGASVKIEDLDKRIYNEKVFEFKREKFSEIRGLKILVVGNSFARDFINMTTETFDMKNIEIIYRDDLSPCMATFRNSISARLYAAADIIVFADGYERTCIDADILHATSRGQRIYYIGTKDFGYNLNWLMQLDSANRANQSNPLPDATAAEEREAASTLPREHYISLLSPIVRDGRIPITDDQGRLLSTDRLHLTKFGAKFFGDRVLRNSAYGHILDSARSSNETTLKEGRFQQ